MRKSLTSFLRLWLTDRRGDMVWSAVIMAFVLVPLASLTVDVPRYFILKARLQAAADAAAQAAAQVVDVARFLESGDVALQDDGDRNYRDEARETFAVAAQAMGLGGYAATLAAIGNDGGRREVTVRAEGQTHLFFGLSPRVTVRVAATSKYRMVTAGRDAP